MFNVKRGAYVQTGLIRFISTVLGSFFVFVARVASEQPCFIGSQVIAGNRKPHLQRELYIKPVLGDDASGQETCDQSDLAQELCTA